jgi:flagellar basal body-associated protein FliL
MPVIIFNYNNEKDDTVLKQRAENKEKGMDEKEKEKIINRIDRHLENGEIRHIYFTEFVTQ